MVNTAKISLLDRIGTRSRVTTPPPRWARVTVHYSWTPVPSGHRYPAEQTPTSAATTEPTTGEDCSASECSSNAGSTNVAGSTAEVRWRHHLRPAH